MKKLILLSLLFFTINSFSQFVVNSTYPVNNSTDVPLHITLKINFSLQLDSNQVPDYENQFFTNIDTIEFTGYSDEAYSMEFEARLQAGKEYFMMVFGGRSGDGSPLSVPVATRFTTASAFSGHSVSGNVTGGSSGVSPENSIIGLSMEPLGDGPPALQYATVTQSDGAFVFPTVADGKYYIIAAKDVDVNGEINPEDGTDVIAIGDSLIVSVSDISGLVVPFKAIEPISLYEAFTAADSMSAELPEDNELRLIEGYFPDTLGAVRSWRFVYTSETAATAYVINIEGFGFRLEESAGEYIYNKDRIELDSSIISNVVLPETFVEAVENAGGYDFRYIPAADSFEFDVSLKLGDLRNSEFYDLLPDQSDKIYWGARYAYYIRTGEDNWEEQEHFYALIDTETGNLVNTISDVSQPGDNPNSFALFQNYPNPFNPSTTISFEIKEESQIKLRIFNLLGEEIETIFKGKMSSGLHRFKWNSNVNSGVYFYTINVTGNDGITRSITRKMLLLK